VKKRGCLLLELSLIDDRRRGVHAFLSPKKVFQTGARNTWNLDVLVRRLFRRFSPIQVSPFPGANFSASFIESACAVTLHDHRYLGAGARP
jgi:hypothetical protein